MNEQHDDDCEAADMMMDHAFSIGAKIAAFAAAHRGKPPEQWPQKFDTRWVTGELNGRAVLVEEMCMGTHWQMTRRIKDAESGQISAYAYVNPNYKATQE